MLRYKNGFIKEVKVTAKSHLIHLHFVDDVLKFGAISLNEWRHLKDLLHVYCQSSRMNISDNKYVFIRG